MQNRKLDQILEEYDLQKHPRGCGYFKETFRSTHQIYDDKLGKNRSIGTQILTLFNGKQTSPLHKVSATQLVNYNSGNTTLLIKMVLEKNLKTVKVGTNPGENLQAEIPPNTWFALTLKDKDDSSMVMSTHTVVPGFDFDDLTFASNSDLDNLEETDKREATEYLSDRCYRKL
jgi:predicted cupin superfamily sugar epimerase